MRLSNVLIIAGQQQLLLGVAAQLFPDPRPPYSYLGCYDNFESGFSSNQVNPSQAGAGDPVKCQSECDIFRGQYLYMQGDQCLCQGENQDPSPPGPPAGDEFCTTPCPRNASAPCGGDLYFTLYGGRPPGGPPTSTDLDPDPRPPYTYLGCYESRSIVGATTIVQENGGDPAACQAACDTRGAAFAGMYRGNNCLCHRFGQPTAPQGDPVGDELCNAPCARNLTAPCGDYDGLYITVYGGRTPTEPPPPTTSLVPKPQPPYRYIGCYNDGVNLVEDFTRVDGAEGNPAACQAACSARGSTYVLMYFIDCQCSNPDAITVFPFRRPVADGFCNEACFDDATAACGGGGVDDERIRYTVYSNRTEPEIVSTTATETATETPAPTTGVLTPDPRPPFSYLGCWRDQDLRVFNYEQTEQTGNPAVCQSQCRARQAVYVAMLADFCYCQPDAPEANRPVGSPGPDGSCDIPCSGNVTAPCGGIGFIGEGETAVQQYFLTLYGLRNETSSSSTLVASTSSASGTLSGSSTSTGPAAGTSTSGTASPTPDPGSSSTGTSIGGTSSTGSVPGGGTTSSTSTFPVFPETLLPPPSTSGSTSSSATPSLTSSSLASGTGSASSGASSPGSSTGSASQSDNPATATTSGTGTVTAVTTETSTGGPFVSTSTFFLVGTPVVFSIFPAGQAPPQTRAS